MTEAGGKGTREWKHAFNDRKLGNWKVPESAEGSRSAKVAKAAGKIADSNALKYAGRAGTAVSFGVDAYQQWQKDSKDPSIGTGEKVTRAATKGAVSAGGAWAGAEAGAGGEVTTNEEVKTAIQTRAVGDPIVFRVMRGGNSENVTVTTVTERDGAPYLGISLSIGYRYAPSISYRIDSSIVGPSAGLVFALAIYDRITDGVLREGRVVAGTGQVDAAGKVYGIGGIREKIKGAEAAGAKLFLMPASNCADLGDLRTDLRLVPVGTLKDAIAVLQLVNEGQSTQEVPSCG